MIVGGIVTSDYDGVEIVDIASSVPMKCNPIPNFPLAVRGIFGSLIDNKVPVVCSGIPFYNQCHEFQNGTWNQTGLHHRYLILT
jgi:hypothetical protein